MAEPIADADAYAAPRVDDLESVFVGDIVTAEHRRSPEEWRFAHERLYGRTLGVLARSDLEYELAFDNLPALRDVLEGGVQDIPAVITQRRGEAIVQGEGVLLVFDENARTLRRERLQQRPDDVQVIRGKGGRNNRAIRGAPFKPVQSGNGRDGSAQKAVDLLNGSARYDRDRSAQRLAQRDQQRRQAVRNVDGLRRRRDIDDAAVEVEKQCPIQARLGQSHGTHGVDGRRTLPLLESGNLDRLHRQPASMNRTEQHLRSSNGTFKHEKPLRKWSIIGPPLTVAALELQAQ